MENEKTIQDLAKVLWPRLAQEGITHRGGHFFWPDGQRIVIKQELPALVVEHTEDLTGPEWARARSLLFGTRIYRISWALRSAAFHANPSSS